MSDNHDRGITVTQISAMDQPIDVSPETTAAFIGRALRGPLNSPVLVHHFGEFCRHFGGNWSRSSLGLAVQQFFQHGGKKLFVVRVANNARGALICLPAEGSALVLRANEPGSSEHLRCAVDYDGIDDSNGELFNLTVQRIDPQSGLIIDQEIFRKLSYKDGTETFVADVLLTSDIVHVEHPYPTHRPDRTVRGDDRFQPDWIDHVQDGSDGAELSDYDLVGSSERGTGLFALQQVEHFDLLYMPPRGKDADVGPAAMLAAELYCRKRGAMLIVDPCKDARDPGSALSSLGKLGYASSHMVSYFPRLRLRGDQDNEPRVAGGAIAGLMCKLDRTYGPWQSLNTAGLGLLRGIEPASLVSDDDRRALLRAGINVIARGPAGRSRIMGSVTLARGSDTHREFSSLPVRRVCLQIINSIDLATRWTVFEQADRKLTARLQRQVLAYFDELADMGALTSREFVVQCDAGLAKHEDRLQHGVTIVLGFHVAGSVEPVSVTLHQTVLGCRVTSTAFAPIVRHCA
ncbi:MAG: hypothetical protein HKN77_02305 [Woeseiaceae bacterium]|nr:hypothetical protein [Woeseiaceae bacterium]